MTEEQFWIAFWKLALAFCFGAIVVMGGCTVRKNELKYEAIKAGVDPMAISCAAGVGTNEQHICTLIAQRGAAK